MSAAKSIMFVLESNAIFASKISCSGYTRLDCRNSNSGNTRCRSKCLPSSLVRSYFAASVDAMVLRVCAIRGRNPCERDDRTETLRRAC